MTASLREQTMATLFALGSTITWTDPVSGQTIIPQSSGRRLKAFQDINGADFPAFFQIEGDERVTQKSNLPYKVTMSAAWVFYHHTGLDKTVSGSQTNNVIVDAVFTALAPLGGDLMNARQTLGGLVYHTWIDAKVFKDPGDEDGQGVVIVPISILLPA